MIIPSGEAAIWRRPPLPTIRAMSFLDDQTDDEGLYYVLPYDSLIDYMPDPA